MTTPSLPSGKISEAMVEARNDAFDESADLRSALSVPTPGTGGADKWLGELLAIIHRDGGQYQAQHGVEKAVEDAHSILAAQAGDLGAVKVGLTSPEAIKNLIGMVRTEAASWREPECYEPRDAVEEAAFLDVIANTLEALSSTPVGEMDGWQPTHKHVKRGSTYRVVAEGRLQTGNGHLVDMHPMTIYQGEDGAYWVRAAHEFHDGRFEALASPQGVR